VLVLGEVLTESHSFIACTGIVGSSGILITVEKIQELSLVKNKFEEDTQINTQAADSENIKAPTRSK
jgi:hypothetical protein